MKTSPAGTTMIWFDNRDPRAKPYRWYSFGFRGFKKAFPLALVHPEDNIPRVTASAQNFTPRLILTAALSQRFE